MMEGPKICNNCILKRMASRSGTALQPAATNPFVRPTTTTNQSGQRRKCARLPILTTDYTHRQQPQLRPTSTTQITLSP